MPVIGAGRGNRVILKLQDCMLCVWLYVRFLSFESNNRYWVGGTLFYSICHQQSCINRECFLKMWNFPALSPLLDPVKQRIRYSNKGKARSEGEEGGQGNLTRCKTNNDFHEKMPHRLVIWWWLDIAKIILDFSLHPPPWFTSDLKAMQLSYLVTFIEEFWGKELILCFFTSMLSVCHIVGSK